MVSEDKKPIRLTNDMTAIQIALLCKKEKPHVRYAVHKDGETVGGFDEKLGHWVIVYRKCPIDPFALDGDKEWITSRHHLTIEGDTSLDQSNWTEVKLDN